MTFHTVSLVYRGHQNISLSKQTIYMGQEGPKYVIDISECSLITLARAIEEIDS